MSTNRRTNDERSWTLMPVALAVCAATISTQLPAQEASESVGGIEEVVVTARKQEERLTNATVAVSAFTAAQIENQGLRSLEDLSATTPGVKFNTQGGQAPGRYNSAIRFRGMDTNQQAASQQLGTVFLDGIYVSNGFSSLSFDNVERVEVIKGPQSATFGRSTFGGAVNYVTRTPSFDPTVKLSADVADFGRKEITGSFEGPLVGDTVAIRVAGRSYSTDGQYRSFTDGGRLGSESTDTAELGLFGRWSNTDVRMRVLYSQDEDGAPAGFYLGGAGTNNGMGPNYQNCFAKHPEYQQVVTMDYFCGELPKVNLNTVMGPNTYINQFLRDAFSSEYLTGSPSGITRSRLTNVPNVDFVGMKRDSFRAMITANHDFTSGWLEDHRLTGTYGFNRMRANWIRDFDQSPVLDWFSSDPQYHKDSSYELRLSSSPEKRLRYSIGASFFDVEYRQDTNGGTNIYNAFGQAPPFNGITTPLISIEVQPTEGAETLGLFGSLAYDITEKVTAQVELRYQEDKITQDNPSVGATPDYEQTFRATLPRATLSYKPVEETTLWATYSEGNLPGFFNTQIVGRSAAEIAQIRAVVGNIDLFNEEETLKNYELGWRNTFLDRRVSLAAVGYFMEWRNQKTRVGVPLILDSGAPTVASVQTNTGGSDLKGVELELQATTGGRLSGYVNTNWAHSEYKNFLCGFAGFYPVPGKDCSGNSTPRYPEWSAGAGVTWKDGLTADLDYVLRADATYAGKTFTDETNFAWIKPGTKVNVRAGVESDAWRAELYVLNVTDNDEYLSAARFSDFSAGYFGFASNQGVAVTPAEKRTIGVRFSYEFNP